MLEWGIILGLLFMFLLFFIGVPVFVSIGFASMLMLILADSTHLLPNLGQGSFEGLNAFTFLAIPLYILTGDIISRTGVAAALLDLAGSLFGAIKGGLSATVIVACGFFAAISGSVASDAAVFARMTVPELEKKGYPRAYGGALVAAGGATAVLIPPSVGYILIGYVLNISIADLFLATIFPGIIVVIMLLIVNFIYVNLRGFADIDTTKRFSFTEVMKNLWRAKMGLFFPFIILGGIYTGIFTPSEAGAVAVAVGTLHGIITRKLTIKVYVETLRSSALVCGTVMPIMAVAYFMGQTMTYFETQKAILGIFLSFSNNPYIILAIMFVILIVFGMFIDLIPNILILGPLLLPVAVKIGMAPEHFSVWFMFTLAFGFITPPYGFNLFVVSSITGESIVAISRRMMPFLIAFFITNIIIVLWPALSLWILGK